MIFCLFSGLPTYRFAPHGVPRECKDSFEDYLRDYGLSADVIVKTVRLVNLVEDQSDTSNAAVVCRRKLTPHTVEPYYTVPLAR